MATLNWAAIDSDPRFRELHDRKTRFLWGLMAFSIVYYFLLPIGAGYFPELYKVKLWGPINVGLVFALSQRVRTRCRPRGGRTRGLQVSGAHRPARIDAPQGAGVEYPRPRLRGGQQRGVPLPDRLQAAHRCEQNERKSPRRGSQG